MSEYSAKEQHTHVGSKRHFGAGKIALCVLGVIVAVCATVLVFNPMLFNNLKALFKGMTVSSDTIATDMQKNKEDTVTALKESGFEISLDDLERVETGEMTEEEVAKFLYDALSGNAEKASENDSAEEAPTDDTVSVADSESGKNEENGKSGEQTGKTSSETGKPFEDPYSVIAPFSPAQTSSANTPDDAYNKAVSDQIAKLYVLKAQYTSTLASFEADIKAQYLALPQEERGTAAKAKIVSDNMAYVAGLEAQCDAQVNAILAEISSIGKQYGKDDSLVSALKSAYANEKELKKAYYISLYK